MDLDPRLSVTVSAPTNIAVIKYWGKENVSLNTPLNSSVSLTLDQDDLRAITSAMASRSFKEDRLILNNEEENISQSKRFEACMTQMKALAGDKVDEKTGEILVRKEDWKDYKVHIVSRNTFPTAAGLASSAAGYACLVSALAALFNAKEEFPGQFTTIARQGSGSACRSLYGGLVRWNQGTIGQFEGEKKKKEEGEEDMKMEFAPSQEAILPQDDSNAIQIADEHHWPEMRALILVVSDSKKDTSSTSGMKRSVETSPLLTFRATSIVNERLQALEEAYLKKDFETFGELTMKDSNQFHATCLDTFPPIFYMNDTSRKIISAIHAFNQYHGKIVAAYTFDAGPNAVIYYTSPYEEELMYFLFKYFPPMEIPNWTLHRGPSTMETYSERMWNLVLQKQKGINSSLEELMPLSSPCEKQVKTIYATKIGGGPRLMDSNECLIDTNTGLPLSPEWSCNE